MNYLNQLIKISIQDLKSLGIFKGKDLMQHQYFTIDAIQGTYHKEINCEGLYSRKTNILKLRYIHPDSRSEIKQSFRIVEIKSNLQTSNPGCYHFFVCNRTGNLHKKIYLEESFKTRTQVKGIYHSQSISAGKRSIFNRDVKSAKAYEVIRKAAVERNVVLEYGGRPTRRQKKVEAARKTLLCNTNNAL